MCDIQILGNGLVEEQDRHLKDNVHFELFAMKKKKRKHLHRHNAKNLNDSQIIDELEQQSSSSDCSSRGSITDPGHKTIFYPLHLYTVSTGITPCLQSQPASS